ncbi:MAG: hypothetical protein KC620_05100 [Myxococcales bacterium]|nr:hypothetical protein [Myxococcales bacterium]
MWLLVAGCVVQFSIGCGAPEDAESMHQGQQQQGMKVIEPVTPRVLLPTPKEDPGAAEEPPADDGIDEVRETGFSPTDQAQTDSMPECMDCVRETGFVPAPALAIDRIEAGVAHLSWTPIEGIERFALRGTRFDADGHAVESFELHVDGTVHSLALSDLRTVLAVVALGEDGKDRSKESNPIELPPR